MTSSLDYKNYLNLDPSKNGTSILNSSQFLYLLDFLNSSRSGSAQSSSGISFQTFISSLMISLFYCAFQVSIFSLLRCKLKHIYQPNCYYIAETDKIPTLPNGYFDWIVPTVFSPLSDYLKMGLDAYFFLRYLRFLLIMFTGLSLFILPVLIPVNYYSGYDRYTDIDILSFTNGTVPRIYGLDRISMSNIAPKYSSRLSIHLTMAVISIIWFHGLVFCELWSFIKIKNDYLARNTESLNQNQNREYSNTILIDNIPSKLLDKKELRRTFSIISGNRIRNIWFVYNYKDIQDLYKKHWQLVDRIESIGTSYITRNFFEENQKFITDKPKYSKNKYLFSIRNLSNYRIKFIWYLIPTIYYLPPQDQLREICEEFTKNYSFYTGQRERLKARENGPMNDHKYNKVFIQFEDSIHPHLLNQIQISNKLNELDRTIIYVHPQDIIWRNLSVQSNMFIFSRNIVGNLLETGIILGWVVPVAFIGLISQLPYLTTLVPFLRWLNFLPDYITDVISNILSVFLLVCLTQVVPYILRCISLIKCKRTGAEVELDVQKWMFIFFFIHIFLVVTISSGFSVIIEGLLNNPVSIPNILANNLPKCSNFFFSYTVLRGLSYFGNNLIQNYQIFLHFFICPFKDFTARRKFNRLSRPPTYLWGSIYPTISILGAIGLVYSILSPLILIFSCLTFLLVFISFKYSLKYQYNFTNHSETYGQFYPSSIFQLYSGVYFMEICLIGMFALSRNIYNEADCLYHALFTFGLLIVTVIGQIQIQKMFKKLLSQNLPLNLHDRQMNSISSTENKENNDFKNLEKIPENDVFYQQCFQNNKAIIWLPNDIFGHGTRTIQQLQKLGIESSTDDCNLSNNGDLEVFNSPPDS